MDGGGGVGKMGKEMMVGGSMVDDGGWIQGRCMDGWVDSCADGWVAGWLSGLMDG